MVYNGISCKHGIVICFIMVDNSNDSNRNMVCNHRDNGTDRIMRLCKIYNRIMGLWDSAII